MKTDVKKKEKKNKKTGNCKNLEMLTMIFTELS